jgi:hypothetical protein
MLVQLHCISQEKKLILSTLIAAGTLTQKAPAVPVPAWQLSFPHVAIATLSSILFGYHIG